MWIPETALELETRRRDYLWLKKITHITNNLSLIGGTTLHIQYSISRHRFANALHHPTSGSTMTVRVISRRSRKEPDVSWAMDGEKTLPVHMELRGPKHTQTIVLLDAGCSATSKAWIIINVCAQHPHRTPGLSSAPPLPTICLPA